MAKSRKNRWSRAQGIAAFVRVTAAQEPLPKDRAQQLKIDAWLALDAITRGHGSDAQFADLATAANMSMLLAEAGYGKERMESIKAAQDALVVMLARQGKHDKYLLDGEGIKRVRELMEIHDQQVEAATQADLLACIDELHRRADAGEFIQLENVDGRA